ncbi:MAG: hypothetical protein HS115_19755 [Spirochaetales bacterium]|nr:hypothetical protein [Spirochaetales bacterium]
MMLGSNKSDFELESERGAIIKIKPARAVCIVFRAGRPESPAGQMEQSIPVIALIGKEVRPEMKSGEFLLAPCKHGRVIVGYLQGGVLRRLFITIHSQADEFPIYVMHYETARAFLSAEGQGNPYRYIVCDPSVPRIDMMTLKIKNGDAQILLIQPAEEAPAEPLQKPVRATDLMAQSGTAEHASNPVFMARVHLRNLHLDRVKQLLYDFRLKAEEIEFIRTFLTLMIRNVQNKEDLRQARPQLEILDTMFSFVANILARKSADEIIGAIAEQAVADLKQLVGFYRQRADSKEEEIFFWELEYRLNKNLDQPKK